jgi:hypothetical protein
MTDTQDTANSRIDADRLLPEASPSAGWRATAALMHVTAGLEECDVPRCDHEGERLKEVDGDTDDVRREDVRCIDHEKDIMEVST